MNSRLFFSSSSLPRVKIDPLLTTFGDASSGMSFLLTFNGIDLFTATATLNHGLLTTSGAFSLGEFDTVTTSTGVTATLKRIDFSVPFSIGMGDVNKDLPFEFDQTFRANAANGGSAFAGCPGPRRLCRLPWCLAGGRCASLASPVGLNAPRI
jgi:hypothetical protein